jgi:amino acid transporter
VPLYLSVLLWATCGFEYSGFLAGDVDKPRRTFPIVMIGTYTSPPASVLVCVVAVRLATYGGGLVSCTQGRSS